MKPEQAAALREEFPANAIGKLPKPTRKNADKGRCEECGGWHGLPAVHLDYVGHAAATDRILGVDFEFTWSPMALAADGLPAIRTVNGEAELWINLTIAGVTRPGVGTAPAGSLELSKQLISDAIRNAGMRFGIALDLWAKEDLHDIQTPPAEPTPPAPATDAQRSLITERTATLTDQQREGLKAWWKSERIVPVERISFEEAGRVIAELDRLNPPTTGEEPF